MNPPLHRLAELSFKHLMGELNDNEQNELDNYLRQSEDNKTFFKQLTDNIYINKSLKELYKVDQEQVWKVIVQKTKIKRQGKLVAFRQSLKYAAAIIFIAALGSYLYLGRSSKKQIAKVDTNIQGTNTTVLPGTTSASLTLSDGKIVELGTSNNGTIALQGATQILNKDGKLVYEGNSNSKVLYNTIRTVRGQTFPVVLSDNSRIWLNSESSIRFPVSFNGHQRKVEITGNIYFEIVHDANKPFIVSVNGMDVHVLGTKFDVKAYGGEEAIKTTLLEGSVKIKKGMQQVVIKPGQQAQATDNQITVKNDVPVDQVVGWTKGYIYLNNEKLSEIMKDVARWYNIEVQFAGNAKNLEMIGRINRHANLSEFIKLLEASNIDAEIKGNKLTLRAQ